MFQPPTNETLNLYDKFLAEASIDRLQKILARYELFKMVHDVPGDLVECGVFKGSGIYTLAKLQRLFMPHGDRRIVGFDFFGADRTTSFERVEDKKVLDEHAKTWSSQETILASLAKQDIRNVELVAGNVIATTAQYARDHVGFRISLLYLDVDNYEGTLAILKNLYPLVSPGGLVVFDEYAIRGHGESDAVDAYFKDNPPHLRSLPWANTPSAYFIKEKR
ncbi:MAG: class I SAM-dependent methyltransferase [Candidatus Magasanikbacteria bacterium]|nr:class I SAM-dependent methyltransferase [Candidatus Magasanikbacteria bacterium]